MAESHKPLQSAEEVTAVLDYYWEFDRRTYYYIVLGLTTLLRPRELEVLMENPKRYILKNGTLDYKNTGPKMKLLGDKHALISKTFGKRHNRENFVNPDLSIVGNLILKHHNPEVKYGHLLELY